VFRDQSHFWAVLGGEIGDELLAAGGKRGLRGLCYYDSGSRSFYGKRAILTPDDLVGLKIRVQQSRTSMDMVTALGGSPTPISYGELYTALQQGVVDGAENNLPSFHLSRHYEVCRHYSLDEHTRTPDMVLISVETWEGLTAEMQTALSRAARESSIYQRELWTRMESESMKAVEADGVTIHRPDTQPFLDKVAALMSSYEGTNVGRLLERIASVGDEQ
jgi:tripartite ATP-independent transporter DctP family solute receptor